MTLDLHGALATMGAEGASDIFIKEMAENDNSKNQVYLGGGEAALRALGVTFDSARVSDGGKQRALLVDVPAAWISASGVHPAAHAKLVIYPQYPEVRLSGLARGVPRTVEACELYKPRMTGRVLLIGRTNSRWLLWVGVPTRDAVAHLRREPLARSPLARVITDAGSTAAQTWTRLMGEVERLVHGGPVPAVRLTRTGLVAYTATAPNAPGLTFEAVLGVAQNAVSEPDYGGLIELKAFQGRVTLMTPEPTGGVYVDPGKKEFLSRFGRTSSGKRRFNGTYKLDESKVDRELTLRTLGWTAVKPEAYNVDATLALAADQGGEIAASWRLRDIHSHWLAKHDQVLFIQYDRDKHSNTIDFKGPAFVARGTDFGLLMKAMTLGHAFLDPGTSMPVAGGSVKARNQFRVNKGGMSSLYHEFSPIEFD